MAMRIIPVTIRAANAFVERHHRHHGVTQGGRFAMGVHKLITYTLKSESGASLRGAGWKQAALVRPAGQNGWSSRGRPRRYQPVYEQAKIRWETSATPTATPPALSTGADAGGPGRG